MTMCPEHGKSTEHCGCPMQLGHTVVDSPLPQDEAVRRYPRRWKNRHVPNTAEVRAPGENSWNLFPNGVTSNDGLHESRFDTEGEMPNWVECFDHLPPLPSEVPAVAVDAHRKRCEAEMTRDVVFLLQVRRLNVFGLPDGYEHNDETIEKVEDDNGEPLVPPVEVTAEELFKAGECYGDFDTPCVIEHWDIEGVWLDRAEAENYAKAHEYNYRQGWRVYGVCSNGELAAMLRGEQADELADAKRQRDEAIAECATMREAVQEAVTWITTMFGPCVHIPLLKAALSHTAGSAYADRLRKAEAEVVELTKQRNDMERQRDGLNRSLSNLNAEAARTINGLHAMIECMKGVRT